MIQYSLLTKCNSLHFVNVFFLSSYKSSSSCFSVGFICSVQVFSAFNFKLFPFSHKEKGMCEEEEGWHNGGAFGQMRG